MKTAEFARSLGLAPPEPFTRENVLSRLKAAVEYGFWDAWDDYYKDAAYRHGPLRKRLDEAIEKVRA